VLRAPELDTGLQVGSHQSTVKGQNPLPRPAGHASLDAAQGTEVGILGCERILSAHVQLFISLAPLHTQVLCDVQPKVAVEPQQETLMLHATFHSSNLVIKIMFLQS